MSCGPYLLPGAQISNSQQFANSELLPGRKLTVHMATCLFHQCYAPVTASAYPTESLRYHPEFRALTWFRHLVH